MQMPRGAGAAFGGLAIVAVIGGGALFARPAGEESSHTWITPVSDGRPGGAAAELVAQEPTPAPMPTPEPAPPPPRSVFADRQVVAYYGNPYSPIMGILGEYPPEELVRRLRDQAARYQALNPEQRVMPALHLVYSVAQASPGADGTYLYHMPDELVEEYIELTRANDMLFIIDLQNGRADPVAEAARVQHWLRNEHVHLAVDPEFTMAPGQAPGVHIGSLDGERINRIQELLQATALEARVSNKLLIVHQFTPEMIANKPAIREHDRVDVVIDMDGWGPPFGKTSKYEAHVTNEPVEYGAIKLFYRWDKPMLTEEDVQALLPRPNLIIYQ